MDLSQTNNSNAENNVSDVENLSMSQLSIDSSQTNTPNAENNVPDVTNTPMQQNSTNLLQKNTSNAENNVPDVFDIIQKDVEKPSCSDRAFATIKRFWNFVSGKVTIQLYCAQETVITDYALYELEKKRKRHLLYNLMRLSVTNCKDISRIESNQPLIVICLSSSRLSVDLRNAISGVPTGSNTAVLIFHHLKPHALPTESSHTILTKDEVRNVGIIIDVPFFETMGIYECDMNIKAYKTLITFIEDNCK